MFSSLTSPLCMNTFFCAFVSYPIVESDRQTNKRIERTQKVLFRVRVCWLTILTLVRCFVGGRTGDVRATHAKRFLKIRDTLYNANTGKYHCPNCNNGYGRRDTMWGHYRYECGKAPRYKCPYCTLCSKKTSNIYQHIRCMHPNELVTLVKLYWASSPRVKWVLAGKVGAKEFQISFRFCTCFISFRPESPDHVTSGCTQKRMRWGGGGRGGRQISIWQLWFFHRPHVYRRSDLKKVFGRFRKLFPTFRFKIV